MVALCGSAESGILRKNVSLSSMSEEGSRHSSDAPPGSGGGGTGNNSSAGGQNSGGTRNNVVVKIGMVGDAQVRSMNE